MLNSTFDDFPNTQQFDSLDQEAVLLRQIEAIKQKMKIAEDLFDLSDNEALTDACIYQIKALGSYYRYLLGEVRKCGCHREPPKQSKAAKALKAAGLL